MSVCLLNSCLSIHFFICLECDSSLIRSGGLCPLSSVYCSSLGSTHCVFSNTGELDLSDNLCGVQSSILFNLNLGVFSVVVTNVFDHLWKLRSFYWSSLGLTHCVLSNTGELDSSDYLCGVQSLILFNSNLGELDLSDYLCGVESLILFNLNLVNIVNHRLSPHTLNLSRAKTPQSLKGVKL